MYIYIDKLASVFMQSCRLNGKEVKSTLSNIGFCIALMTNSSLAKEANSAQPFDSWEIRDNPETQIFFLSFESVWKMKTKKLQFNNNWARSVRWWRSCDVTESYCKLFNVWCSFIGRPDVSKYTRYVRLNFWKWPENMEQASFPKTC